MKIKLFTASILVFVLLAGMGQTGNVQAADSLDNKKQNVEENLNKVEKDILSAAEKVNEVNENVAVLEAAISSNEEDLTKEKNNVKKYDEEVKSLKKEIKSLEKEIEERNEILKERLSSYQNTGGDLGYLEVIFGSAGFEDFISRFTAVTTITKADNDLVEEQKKSIEKVENKEEEVKEKLAEAEETKNKLAKINEVKKDQKAELVKSVDSAEKEKNKLEDKKTAYVKEGNDIEALEAKADAIKQANVEVEEEEEQDVEQVAAKDTDKQAPNKATETNENTQSKSVSKPKAEKKSTSKPKAEKKSTSKPKAEKKSTSKPKAEKKTTSKPASKPSKPSGDSLKEMTMSATAYTAKCSGCSGITATGINLNNNPNALVVAVDPSVIPLGSKVWVSGYGTAIAGDTGGAIKGNRIDLHFPTKKAAYAFGSKSVTVKVLK